MGTGRKESKRVVWKEGRSTGGRDQKMEDGRVKG